MKYFHLIFITLLVFACFLRWSRQWTGWQSVSSKCQRRCSTEVCQSLHLVHVPVVSNEKILRDVHRDNYINNYLFFPILFKLPLIYRKLGIFDYMRREKWKNSRNCSFPVTNIIRQIFNVRYLDSKSQNDWILLTIVLTRDYLFLSKGQGDWSLKNIICHQLGFIEKTQFIAVKCIYSCGSHEKSQNSHWAVS